MSKRYLSVTLLVVAVMMLSVVAIPSGVTAQEFEPMTYAAPSCDYGGEFLSMEAVDQYTVKFTLCYPDPAFPSKVAFSAFPVYSGDYLEATGGGGDLVDKPIGTGPYMMAEWKRGDSITFQRNEDYWGNKALTPTLVFRWNSEGAARLTELEAGTVDGIDNPTPDDFAEHPRESRSGPVRSPRHQHLLHRPEQLVPAAGQRESPSGVGDGYRPPAYCGQLLPARNAGCDPIHAAVDLRLYARSDLV